MNLIVVNRHALDALGGSEVQCDLIAAGMAQRGHAVTYLAAYPSGRPYATPYPVVPLGRLGFFTIYRAVRKARADVVYWRYGKSHLFAAALASRLAGARFVYSMSHLADGKAWRSTYQEFWRGFFSRGLRSAALSTWRFVEMLRGAFNYLAVPLLCDGVLSNNADFLEGVPARRKAVIHNSMRTEAVPFSWPRPFVAWVANIKKRKNPAAFADLARRLRGSGVDFLMVGNVHDAAFKASIAEWEKEPGFHYLGRKTLEEVNGILAESLLLANTCEPEGFPNNCIQAWLQGRPVVSLAFDPEGALEKESVGLYSRTPERFAADVRGLIEDADARARMGARALDYARREFSATENLPRLERFLNDIVATRRHA